MEYFNDFDIEAFKSKRPPADNSMETFKEINDINRIPIDKKFVEYNDDQEKVFKDVFKKNSLPFPNDLFVKLKRRRIREARKRADNNTPERLEVREICQAAKVKQLKRGYESET